MSNPTVRNAPGWPGIQPRWTSSAKTGIGTALNLHSRVWFTLSHGILNEIYYPRVDQACTRDQGFLVTDGKSFFSEEKRNCIFENVPLEPGIPVYELRNVSSDGRYRIEKEILTDPYRNVVIQKVRFVPLKGTLADYHLYALLAPHLGNFGNGNNGWVGDYKGFPMLYAAERGAISGFRLFNPMEEDVSWFCRSIRRLARHIEPLRDVVGVHASRKWQHRTDGRNRFTSCGGEFVTAIGLGAIWSAAGQRSTFHLLGNYEGLRERICASLAPLAQRNWTRSMQSQPSMIFFGQAWP